MSNFEVRKDRLRDTPISHTKKNYEKSVRMMEEESYPKTREKVPSMLEDKSHEQSASPLGILSAQQQNGQEILNIKYGKPMTCCSIEIVLHFPKIHNYLHN